MRLSRLAVAVAAFTIFASGAAAATIARSMFTDVSVNHWAFDAIKWAVDTKVMKTPVKNLFKPETPATRAELAHASQQLYKNLSERLEAVEAATGVQASASSAATSAASLPEYKRIEERNAQRRAAVSAISNALYQYTLDNNKLPPGIGIAEKEICATGASSCAGLLKLDVLRGIYLVAMPRDPLEADPQHTGYTVTKDAQGRVTVKSLHAENEAIRITR